MSRPLWDRRAWMAAAVVSVLAAVLLLLWAETLAGAVRDRVHTGAQLQFMHGMATFACATFMNIGARRARHAPALFLSGSLAVAASFYAEAAGFGALPALRGLGAAVLAAGWLVLLGSARTIDRA